MNFVTDLILGFFVDFIRDVYARVGYQITFTYTYMISINQTSQVTGVCIFSSLLGAAVSMLMVAKKIIGTYGFGTEGDPDQDPIEIVFRLSMALGMMGANTWLFNELLNFSLALSSDVMAVMIGDTKLDLQNTVENVLEVSSGSPFMLCCYGVITMGTIIFAITNCIRGAEITLSKILLPIFAIDLINSNCEKWKMFIFQYVISFLSFVAQLFCYEMFTILFYNLNPASMNDWFVLMGWLILTIKSPKWLERYMYATGTGQAISRGAQGIGQVIMTCGMRI